jgi:hypothetical protein
MCWYLVFKQVGTYQQSTNKIGGCLGDQANMPNGRSICPFDFIEKFELARTCANKGELAGGAQGQNPIGPITT